MRRPALGTMLGGAALFVALGGTSAARDAVTSAVRAIDGSRLEVASVTRSKLAPNAVTSAKIKNRTIRSADLAASVRSKLGVAGPPGVIGPAGPAGPAGPTGPQGPAAALGADSVGTAEIKNGNLAAADIGRFAGRLEDLPFGTVNPDTCASVTSTTLTPVIANQDLRDDAIVVTPTTDFPDSLTVAAKAAGATQISVTVCNAGSAVPVNVGARDFHNLSVDAVN